MPCWYYDKKDLQNTPSFRAGISPETESRYRRDGARFIIDAGAKMGLRYDTCATGVVYFHRFYMFHSFSEFPRCVTAACCLFLAGKVEETPKKCKDLIKITKSMLSEAQFATFKDDPKEEIMTVERILLQTIKFDLMVEHPYAFLLKFAKLIKGDKAKIQKLVQMSWTFINDSLCTTLSLQWEPEVIAIALMYLASRLNKFEINDWQSKPLGYKGKWYEYFVEDITLDLLEDICHQVLDLYSKPSQKQEASPVKYQPNSTDASLSTLIPSNKKLNNIGSGGMDADSKISTLPLAQVSSIKQQPQQITVSQCQNSTNYVSLVGTHTQQFSQTNPYVATGMYSSSFLSQEGSQSIQSLVDNQEGSSHYHKVVGHPQSLQQSNQTYQSSAIQYVYQQPMQTIAPGTVVQSVAPMQGFSNNVPTEGSFAFPNSCVQVKPQTIYQETSPGTVLAPLQPNVHSWR